jgi:hypothetical protein
MHTQAYFDHALEPLPVASHTRVYICTQQRICAAGHDHAPERYPFTRPNMHFHSAFVPLAMIVSMELAILAQSLFMSWDEKMCAQGKRMRPYSSALNSELGQVCDANVMKEVIVKVKSTLFLHASE